MSNDPSEIKLNVLFLPSRELFAVDLIKSLYLIELSFKRTITINQMMQEIKSYINREENFELKLRVLFEEEKPVSTMKLYHNVYGMQLEQILDMLIKNNDEIVNGKTIDLFGLFKTLYPSQKLEKEEITEGAIIVCEYFQSTSLFSTSEKEKKMNLHHEHAHQLLPLMGDTSLFGHDLHKLDDGDDEMRNPLLDFLQKNLVKSHQQGHFPSANPFMQLLHQQQHHQEMSQAKPEFLSFMSELEKRIKESQEKRQPWNPYPLISILQEQMMNGPYGSKPQDILKRLEALPHADKNHPVTKFYIETIKATIEREERGLELINSLKEQMNQFEHMEEDPVLKRRDYYNQQLHRVTEPLHPMDIFEENEVKSPVQSNPMEYKKNKRFIYKAPIGLTNLGNTCYINATIQCLSCCEELSNYFLSDSYLADIVTTNSQFNHKLMIEYVNVLNVLWNSTAAKHSPFQFVNCFKAFFKQFNNTNQHDMEEFFSILIDYFKEGLNKSTSIVHQLFNGVFKYSITCSMCHSNTIQNEPFITLSVPLEQIKPQTVICYFFFNNNKTQPYEFHVELTPGLTVELLNQNIAKALKSPLNAFAIGVDSKGRFDDITHEKSKLIQSIDSKDKLCIVLLNPELFKISIAKLNDIFAELKNPQYKKAIGELKGKEAKMALMYTMGAKMDNKKWVKVLLFHEKYSTGLHSNSKEVIDAVPHIVYIPTDLTYEKLYDYLIDYYSFFFEDRREKLFTQRDIPECQFVSIEAKLTNPFIILYETIQPVETPFTSSKPFWHSIVITWDKEKTFQSLLQENLENDSLQADDYLELEVILSIVWHPNYEAKLLNINKTKAINLPLFNPTFDLNECFQRFFRKELLTTDNKVDCTKCQMKQNVDKQIQIIKMPQILVIHFKRLHNGQKIDTLISFPLQNLSIANYLSADCEDKDNSLYDLFAVGYHKGNFAFGHYFSRIKNSADNHWYKVSDEVIKKVVDENKILSSKAYILFYKKKPSG